MALKDLITRNLPIKHERENHPMSKLQGEMNRMFDRFFNGISMDPFQEREFTTFPKIDIKETKKEVQIRAELPGLDAKDIDISLSDNVLTLRGEKKMESKREEENYYHRELSYGAFNRSIALPSEVESDKVNAEFRNGVLKVVMNKKPEEQQKLKKIKINSN